MVLLQLKNYQILNFLRKVHYEVQPELLQYCSKIFEIAPHRMQSIFLKHPKLQKLTEKQIEAVLSVCSKYNIENNDVLKHPKLLNIHPITIQNRIVVFKECGFKKIDTETLSKYVFFMQKTVIELQQQNIIESKDLLWKRLINHFNYWSDAYDYLRVKIPMIEEFTLSDLRMHILQQFLEAKYDMTKSTFELILKTYTPVKHKPLGNISRTVHLLEEELNMPKEKMLSLGFFYLLEPENITGLIHKVKSFGGINMKKIIMTYPVILRTNYEHILEIQNVLKQEGISEEAQATYPLICTLSTNTLVERLQMLKSMPDLKGHLQNPKVIKLLYHQSKVMGRIEILNKLNKKCSSIHKLITHQQEFEQYLEQASDKSKGVDIINVLKTYFESIIEDSEDIRKQLTRQPFWTHVSLTSVMQVFNYLSQYFSKVDIFHNCPLLLYQLLDVKNITTKYLNYKNTGFLEDDFFLDLRMVDLKNLDGKQSLSLILYYIERRHNFTSYGLWSRSQERNEQ